MQSLEEIILSNYGGISKNNLSNILITDIDDPLIHSPYCTPEDMCTALKNKHRDFTILSLNCQSLQAKYNQLILFLENIRLRKIIIDAICLQETWLGENSDMSLLQIPNYSRISQNKHCSEHGGLMIYLHEKYQYEIYNISQSSVWEGMLVKVICNRNGKYLYLANIYRPPKDNLSNNIIQQFIDELSIILNDLNHTNSTLIISGDFNIDLLKIPHRPIFRDYIETLIGFGLLPHLTLPTRISNFSAIIIDNIFSNYPYKTSHSLGIIITEISDHFPYF